MVSITTGDNLLKSSTSRPGARRGDARGVGMGELAQHLCSRLSEGNTYLYRPRG